MPLRRASPRGPDRAVIINADDLGFSAGITAGILRAHREGVITSTTLVANLPGAGEALRQAGALPDLGTGVHLNACQGPPLSREGHMLVEMSAASGASADRRGRPPTPPYQGGEMHRSQGWVAHLLWRWGTRRFERVTASRGLVSVGCPPLYQGGEMRWTAQGLILACCLHPCLLDAVEAEFDAQVRWVLDHGIRPTHLDSHRHVHAFPPIFRRVVKLAERYGIRFIRWHHEPLSLITQHSALMAGVGVSAGARPRGLKPAALCTPAAGWPAARTGETPVPHNSPAHWPVSPRKQRVVSAVLNVFGAINARIAPQVVGTRGTWGVAHTGGIDAGWLIRAAGSTPLGVIEIMTHPGLAYDLNPLPDRQDAGPTLHRRDARATPSAGVTPADHRRDAGAKLSAGATPSAGATRLDAPATRLVQSRAAELTALCDPAVREAFHCRGVKLVHYGQL